jgi:branched-chain amino acid aminotransferase
VIIPEFKKVDEKIYNDGIRIGRVPNIRPNEKILDPRFNTLSKLNCILASIEANKMGFDEGIMNDINGNISTCNSTNLFFILDNEVWTSTGQYCLNGITRGEIIDVCRKNKISIFEQDFTFADIKNCQEAFVTGTFSGVIPVSYIENKKLNSTNYNSITNTIKTLYFEDIESNCK